MIERWCCNLCAEYERERGTVGDERQRSEKMPVNLWDSYPCTQPWNRKVWTMVETLIASS